jgi:hypothetical protein
MSKHEAADDYAFLFKSAAKCLKEIYDFDLQPTCLVADGKHYDAASKWLRSGHNSIQVKIGGNKMFFVPGEYNLKGQITQKDVDKFRENHLHLAWTSFDKYVVEQSSICFLILNSNNWKLRKMQLSDLRQGLDLHSCDRFMRSIQGRQLQDPTRVNGATIGAEQEARPHRKCHPCFTAHDCEHGWLQEKELISYHSYYA